MKSMLEPASAKGQRVGTVCKYWSFRNIYRLGSVAGPVIEANARPELEDGLRAGAPLPDVARRSGVRTKLGVNMGALGEPEVGRLSKYVGIGPDRKRGSSNYKRRAVVGKRWRVCRR